MKKKLISLLAASALTLTACGGGEETSNNEEETEVVAEDSSLIVAESAEKTAQNVAAKYNYEMVDSEPADTAFGIVDLWKFDKHFVYANSDGGLLHLVYSIATKNATEEALNNESFPITSDLESMLTAESWDQFLDGTLPTKYENEYEGILLTLEPHISKSEDIFFNFLFSIAPE